MILQVTIKRENRNLFDSYLIRILPLSYLVDVECKHERMNSRYEIPCDNENQKRTIQNVERMLQ